MQTDRSGRPLVLAVPVVDWAVMDKRKSPRKPTLRSGARGLWIITGLAVVLAIAAVAIGWTLPPHKTPLDSKLFFVIGAGLSAVVLLLIAQVWRYVTSGR
jgi:membrane protein YdbS with pleckstrin-like domain